MNRDKKYMLIGATPNVAFAIWFATTAVQYSSPFHMFMSGAISAVTLRNLILGFRKIDRDDVEKRVTETFECDTIAAFRVEGIETWIRNLLEIEKLPEDGSPTTALRMVDKNTGAVFLIKRIE